MATIRSPVLIAGAGPTGLVLALWLTRSGIPVRIVDRASEPGTTSRALAVQVRTIEFYSQLGIADRFIEEGVRIPALNFWASGEHRARVPFRDLGAGLTPFPFVLIVPQDEHEKFLIARLAELGVMVERGTELREFRDEADHVAVRLQRPDGEEEWFRASYLAGCDGASSRVRQQLEMDFPGGTYAGRFYVADVVASGAATNGELHVDLEEADFLIVFPLRREGHVRLVGRVDDDEEGDSASLAFEDVRGHAVAGLRLDVSHVNWFSTYQVHHRVASSFRRGRVFLLGDAAHIHSPVGGQGMNTGIGDAVNLAWKLAAVITGDFAPSLLDSYEPERIAFARRLVATTDRAFTFVTRRGPLARLVRTRVVPMVVPRAFPIAAVRRLLFRTISQTGVNYRESALSSGSVGALRAGDRLPWVELAEGKDNFAPLRARDWQVHVYGSAPHAVRKCCEELDLPLHTFHWHEHMRTAGITPGALYLIRPDGYVALADSEAEPWRLRAYWSGIKAVPA